MYYKIKLSSWKWIIIIAFILSLIVVFYFVFRKKTVSEIHPTVNVELVGTEDIELYGEYVGRVRAQQFVEIHTRVEGFLEQMLFEEGTRVEKGQILFIIDPKLYKAKVDRAKAQLNKNKAIERQSKRNIDRIRPLCEQNAASQLDLDNAIAAYESAMAEVSMSEADLIQAEMELGYTVVRSPISGFISERNVDIGTFVGSGGKSLLVTIVKSDTVKVDFSMTELEYLQFKARNVNLGLRDTARGWDPYITLTLADKTEYPYRGFVDFAEPQVNPHTGTFSVRAEMPNPEHILLPGQATKVKLLLDVRKNAVVIPSKAVIIEKGGAYVYVIRSNTMAEKRFVELGPESGNKMVIERGLVEDETLVVEGFHKLSPAVRVEVVDFYVNTEDE